MFAFFRKFSKFLTLAIKTLLFDKSQVSPLAVPAQPKPEKISRHRKKKCSRETREKCVFYEKLKCAMAFLNHLERENPFMHPISQPIYRSTQSLSRFPTETLPNNFQEA